MTTAPALQELQKTHAKLPKLSSTKRSNRGARDGHLRSPEKIEVHVSKNGDFMVTLLGFHGDLMGHIWKYHLLGQERGEFFYGTPSQFSPPCLEVHVQVGDSINMQLSQP